LDSLLSPESLSQVAKSFGIGIRFNEFVDASEGINPKAGLLSLKD